VAWSGAATHPPPCGFEAGARGHAGRWPTVSTSAMKLAVFLVVEVRYSAPPERAVGLVHQFGHHPGGFKRRSEKVGPDGGRPHLECALVKPRAAPPVIQARVDDAGPGNNRRVVSTPTALAGAPQRRARVLSTM